MAPPFTPTPSSRAAARPASGNAGPQDPWPAGPVPARFAISTVGGRAESAMYAIFEDGSRQYRVSEGDLVQLDYRDAEKGARLEFNRVLLYTDGADTRI